MDIEDRTFVIGGCLGVFFGGIIGWICGSVFDGYPTGLKEGHTIARKEMQLAAAEEGVAEWIVNPKTGETVWVWKRCDDE